MFAKLDEIDNIVYAPKGNVLKYNGKVVINPKESNYIEAGYVPIIEDENNLEEKEGYYITIEYSYNDDKTAINGRYVYKKNPDEVITDKI